MSKKRCIAALVFAALFALVILFSVLFTVSEADHECSGEDCPICYQINLCEQILKAGGGMLTVAIVVAFADFIISIHLPEEHILVFRDSLVALKVKLSN